MTGGEEPRGTEAEAAWQRALTRSAAMREDRAEETDAVLGLMTALLGDDDAMTRYEKACAYVLRECVGELVWLGGSGVLHLTPLCDVIRVTNKLGAVGETSVSETFPICPSCIERIRRDGSELHRRAVRRVTATTVGAVLSRAPNRSLFRGGGGGDGPTRVHLWDVCPAKPDLVLEKMGQIALPYSRRGNAEKRRRARKWLKRLASRPICEDCCETLWQRFLAGFSDEYRELFPLGQGVLLAFD